MDKIEYRAVIKFLTKEGQTSDQIFHRLHAVYGDSAPSLATVSNWAREFMHGRESLEDDPRSGAPKTVVNDQIAATVEKLIIEDRRISLEQIAHLVGISKGSVHSIIHNILHMNKVTTKWVPRILTPDMRQSRKDCSIELLHLIDCNPQEIFQRIVTGDETWIHYYDPETQAEAKEWKRSSSPTPTRSRATRSVGKVMASVFWDQEGILLLDYLPHKQTITGQYYAQLMTQLRDAVKRKRRGKLTAGILLLHDNAPSHKSRVASAAIRECGFEELNHPAYSPDLAPSDFYLFANLKQHLRGRKFKDDDELKSVVTRYFESKPPTFYNTGIVALRDRYSRVVASGGEYIE
jgi:histone-lysine N-methyltransferase SETMAR